MAYASRSEKYNQRRTDYRQYSGNRYDFRRLAAIAAVFLGKHTGHTCHRHTNNNLIHTDDRFVKRQKIGKIHQYQRNKKHPHKGKNIIFLFGKCTFPIHLSQGNSNDDHGHGNTGISQIINKCLDRRRYGNMKDENQNGNDGRKITLNANK